MGGLFYGWRDDVKFLFRVSKVLGDKKFVAFFWQCSRQVNLEYCRGIDIVYTKSPIKKQAGNHNIWGLEGNWNHLK